MGYLFVTLVIRAVNYIPPFRSHLQSIHDKCKNLSEWTDGASAINIRIREWWEYNQIAHEIDQVTELKATWCQQASKVQSLSGPTKRESYPDPLGDSELLDIVLVASVDGKLHALNRTTGRNLWSMSSFASPSGSVAQPSTLAPLVRTRHIDQGPDLADDDAYHEAYIIEPQSGDIYVMATPSSPLQRFPFTMSELVDMSPFSFAAGDDHRVFVGRKETSLLVVELETGNIKATIDLERPWDPFEDLREAPDGLDLDELEGEQAAEIDGGDYYIAIHTRPSSKHRIPVQNLSFSTYGPNNQDNILQYGYRHTKDDAYIQSLPNGEIMSFKARGECSAPEDTLLWAFKFNNPIVAVFDVLRNPTQHPPNTFVLLQPRPQLSAILPKLATTSMNQLPRLHSAYIGMVEEIGSLFAMSPDRFPLVVFSGGKRNKANATDPPADEPLLELPGEIDAITAERKRREKTMKERNHWGGDGDGSEMHLKWLIDDVLSVLPQLDPLENATRVMNGTVDGAGNTSTEQRLLTVNSTHDARNEQPADNLFVWKGIAFAFVIQFLCSRNPPLPPLLPPQETTPPPSSPQILATNKLPSLPPDVADDGEDSDEDEIENGRTPAVPGTKRKNQRGRRVKGKKPDVVDVENGALDSSEKETQQEKPMQNGVAPDGNPLSPSGLSFFPTIPIKSPPVEPSLVVSDHVLGYGSHGTVVYRGALQGRAVAVKRLLQDFVTLASREYYQEAHSNFLYIVLELCPATLADLIETLDRDAWRDIAVAFGPKRALRQITSGRKHLHGLKLIHRDIKPQNILVSSGAGRGGATAHRILISDFGLCKKLDVDQTSFLPTLHGAMAAGSVGWRAPEILRGDVKLDLDEMSVRIENAEKALCRMARVNLPSLDEIPLKQENEFENFQVERKETPNELELSIAKCSEDGLWSKDDNLLNDKQETNSIAPIDAFLHNQQRRAVLLAQSLSSADLCNTLRSCDQLICASLLAILDSRNSKDAVLMLEADRSQSFMDAVQDIIERGSLSISHTAQARRLVVRLSAASDQLPSSLFITGVTDHDEQPTFRGGFGDVYRASRGDKTVALKRIRMFQSNTQSESKRIRLSLQHEYILPLIGIDPWHSPKISQPARACGRGQVATSGGGGPRLPAFDEHCPRRLTRNKYTASYTSDTSSTNHAGSTRWLAPELIQPGAFGCDRFVRTYASDVYAFACVCLELHTGRPPFLDVALDAPVIFKVIAGERPARPDTSMSDDLWELITAAWAQNFYERPNIEAIIERMQTNAGVLLNHG
ncbi:hypothetical protein MSAN_00924600 [Mycena sanguinolenta]|uniref:Protein kinase domain-containing protein n=1 Tax=Mycena sanguinolenta TaxID=230812 RepID=A0A8H6YXC0_9AGAR|nr:hypothetical protein MSAN_00924600 [Mycena sanguinolenta]